MGGIGKTALTKYGLRRNPKDKNAGTFVTLADFLSVVDKKPYFSIRHHDHCCECSLSRKKAGLRCDRYVVIDALSKAGYDKPGSHQKVYIQSTNSSVLLKFKEKTTYELVYKIVGDASDATGEAIKNFPVLWLSKSNLYFLLTRTS